MAYYVWNQAQNQQAQEKARQNYCAANRGDRVCGDLIVVHIYSTNNFRWIDLQIAVSVPVDDWNTYADYRIIDQGPSQPFRYYIEVLKTSGWYSLFNVDPKTLTETPIHSIPWKDWPQEKRDAAVQLLNDSDWQGFITSMPEGGTLNPGDTINAPTIVIPGTDGTKTQSGPYTIPDGYPNAVPSPSPSPSPDPSPDSSPSPSPDPSPSPSPSPSPDPSPDPSPSPSPDPSPDSSPSPSPDPSPSPSPSPSPDPSPDHKKDCYYTIDERHIFYPDVRDGRITGFHSTARAGEPQEDEGNYYWITEPAEYEADYEPFTAEFGIPQRSSLGTKTSSFFPLLLLDSDVIDIIGEAYVKSGCRAYGIWAASVDNPLIENESITIEGSVTNHRITTAYPFAPDVPND